MPYVFRKKSRFVKRRPAAKSRTTRTTRRTYRRSKGYSVNSRRNHLNAGSTRAGIQRGYLPFGRNYFARLPYVENFGISATSPSFNISQIGYTFRLNSMFDPRFQVGGHQPMQYDELMAHYEVCLVHAAKVTLTFFNPTTDGAYVGYRVRTSQNAVATANQDITYIQEMRDSPCRPLAASGTQKKTFTTYVSMHKIFGVTKQQYAANYPTFGHTPGTNPVQDVLLEPYIIATQADCHVQCNISVTFFAQCFNPQTPPQS